MVWAGRDLKAHLVPGQGYLPLDQVARRGSEKIGCSWDLHLHLELNLFHLCFRIKTSLAVCSEGVDRDISPTLITWGAIRSSVQSHGLGTGKLRQEICWSHT